MSILLHTNTTTKPLNQNKMKQTAVEKMIQYFIEQKNNGASHWCIDDLIAQLHQAKAMEKEYLERFYNQGYTQCSIEDLEPKSRERFVDAEDYYNKTFKSE